MAARTDIKLLDTPSIAGVMGMRPNTLEIWRTKGEGPPYRKVGRAVRYVESEVIAWIESRRHTNTSQYPTHLSKSIDTSAIIEPAIRGPSTCINEDAYSEGIQGSSQSIKTKTLYPAQSVEKGARQ